LSGRENVRIHITASKNIAYPSPQINGTVTQVFPDKKCSRASSVTVPGMEMWDETVRGFLFSLFKKV